jgi:steroid delta-isomerase-like uncharacterized protein
VIVKGLARNRMRAVRDMRHSRELLGRQVRRFYEELWNEWRFDLAPELLAQDLSFRGSLGSEVHGPAGFVDYARGIRDAFPDFHNQVQELLVDQLHGKIAARLRYTGTHDSPIFGLAATGRRISYAGAAFFEFDSEARIARAWVLGDLVNLLRSLDVDDLSIPAGRQRGAPRNESD